MKYIRTALAMLFMTSSAIAATPAEGWYAGGIGGLSFMPGINVLSPNPEPFIALNKQYNPVMRNMMVPIVILKNDLFPGFLSALPLNSRLDYGLGGAFGGQLGYRICNVRLEGELLFNYSPFSELKYNTMSIKRHVTPTNPLRLSGQTVFGAILFNGYYDFYDEEDDPTLVPYVGLGGGYSYVRNSITFSIPYLFHDNFSLTSRVTDNSVIGQLIVGLSYYYSDDLFFGVDYRYLTTPRMSNAGFNTRVQTSTVNLSVNFALSD